MKIQNLFNILAFGLTLLTGLGLSNAQQAPGLPQQGPIRISGATLHVGNGTVIEEGVLDFDAGLISYAGPAASAPPAAGRQVIDARGQHIYPGLIAPCTTIGLLEVSAVKATVDADEIGDFIPHVRSLIAYNAESRVVESMRPNGVLLTQATPTGGIISGSSSIVQLDAWNWEDAVVKADDGIHLNWPSYFRRGRTWQGEAPGLYPNQNYAETTSSISDYFTQARAYSRAAGGTFQQDLEAMKGLFSGQTRLYLYADGAREIQDGISLLKTMGVEKVVLVGGYEAPKVLGFLKEHRIPVLVAETHSLPNQEDEDYDYTYRLPHLLHEQGILVGIQNSGKGNWQTRNLPFYAGQIVGQGMDSETALSLITLNTARILGIEARYGSLETGKSATFFVSEGDALEMIGNRLTHAFIDGRTISLETHQTGLWKRYTEKYSAQPKPGK